eukprot:5115696-Amphidinium_carterae.2
MTDEQPPQPTGISQPAELPPQPPSRAMVSRTPSPTPVTRTYEVPTTPAWPAGATIMVTRSLQEWVLRPPLEMREFLEPTDEMLAEAIRGCEIVDHQDMRRRISRSRSGPESTDTDIGHNMVGEIIRTHNQRLVQTYAPE